MELIEYPNNDKCKLGIFDSILRKWFCNPFNDEGEFFIPNMITAAPLILIPIKCRQC